MLPCMGDAASTPLRPTSLYFLLLILGEYNCRGMRPQLLPEPLTGSIAGMLYNGEPSEGAPYAPQDDHQQHPVLR